MNDADTEKMVNEFVELIQGTYQRKRESHVMVFSTPSGLTPTLRRPSLPAFKPFPIFYDTELRGDSDITRFVNHMNAQPELPPDFALDYSGLFDQLKIDSLGLLDEDVTRKSARSLSDKVFYYGLRPGKNTIVQLTRYPNVGTIGHIDYHKPTESTLTRVLRMMYGNYEPRTAAQVIPHADSRSQVQTLQTVEVAT